MPADLQFFVPWTAYAAQLAVGALGLALLLPARGVVPGWLIAGTAYPAGFAAAGLCQWAAYVGGVGGSAPVIAAGVAALAAARCAYFGRGAGIGAGVPWAVVLPVALLAPPAVLVCESTPLHETDPRFQLAYRAKMMAAFGGIPETPHLTDPTVIHTNPHYPLLFSGAEALTLRAAGGGAFASAVRPIGVMFFLSFATLVAGYGTARLGPARGLLPLLAAAAVPRVWSLGVDELYADFPCGVGVLALTLWLTAGGPARRPGTRELCLALLAALVAGSKSEGVALVGVWLGAAVLAAALTRVTAWRWYARGAAAAAAGAAVSYGLHLAGVSQMTPEAPMENVQLADLRPATLLRNLDRWPVVAHYFLTTFSRPAYFGFFFPLVLVVGPAARTAAGITALATGALYTVAATVPFLATTIALEFHLSTTVSRFAVQVLPALVLALTDGFGVVFPPRAAPDREGA